MTSARRLQLIRMAAAADSDADANISAFPGMHAELHAVTLATAPIHTDLRYPTTRL